MTRIQNTKLHRQSLPPLGAAAFQNIAAVFGAVSFTKAVDARPAAFGWLIGSFHSNTRINMRMTRE